MTLLTWTLALPRLRVAIAVTRRTAPPPPPPPPPPRARVLARVDGCQVLELAPAPAALPSPAVTAIVAALAEGPATLSALRNRVGRAGRRHLSTAEVAQAVEAGLVAFDHATQTYLRRAS